MTVEIPVLIAGGGPIGLALAADLGRRGVAALLVEQNEDRVGSGEDARGERPHHGVLPPARHRRDGAQLGLSARPSRSTAPSSPSLQGYEIGRVVTPSLAAQRRDRRSAPSAALPCPQTWFDPILQRYARSFPPDRAALPHAARKLRAGRGRRHRDLASTSAADEPKPCAAPISSAPTASPARCAICSASRSAASGISTGR